jgi:aspartyl-tRNA synthetase
MKRTMNLETAGLVGQEVTVSGWVHSRRDMGKLAFLDVRDRSALLQAILVPAELSERGKDHHVRYSFGVLLSVSRESCRSGERNR